MMKRNKWILWCATFLCALCCMGAGRTNSPHAASLPVLAEDAKDYEWKGTEIISIAPPFTYSVYETASFQVFFDKDITGVNYKHLAAGADVLKTFSRNDNPNMTPAIIDSLDQSGVFDSMNDCIAFNGKTVREWQQLGPLACMIQVGELGVNNSMNIDFNGGIPGSKITDFNQAFTFTFYEGLKFPSGVELKETVTWKYDPAAKTFAMVAAEGAADEAGFSVYYNGQKITKEDNLVTIYDRKAFSLDYLTVYAENYEANVTIEPQFESLSDGYNYLLITVKAKNKVDFEHLQIVFDLQQVELPAEEGCSSTVSLWGGLALLPALALVCAKRSEKE